ncbi:MAG TPA: hypothetical protein VFX09_01520 [Burkholderiales bacterium]|nr:hypothetical protein [Burkholderiales bacterium]
MELKQDPAHDGLQELYARWLDRALRVAFAVALAAFALYVSGLVPAFIEPRALSALWGLPLAEFLERSGAPAGWGWLGFLGYSDYLSLLGVALFAAISALCLVRSIPAFFRHGERLQAWLAFLQIAVLLFAASGTLAGSR